MAVTRRLRGQVFGSESHVSNNRLMAYLRLLALKNDMQEINRFSTGFSDAAWQPFEAKSHRLAAIVLSRLAFVPIARPPYESARFQSDANRCTSCQQ
jgi:hypothetical protein